MYEGFLLLEALIQPHPVVLWRKDHRHAVVDLVHQVVGIRADEEQERISSSLSQVSQSQSCGGEGGGVLHPDLDERGYREQESYAIIIISRLRWAEMPQVVQEGSIPSMVAGLMVFLTISAIPLAVSWPSSQRNNEEVPMTETRNAVVHSVLDTLRALGLGYLGSALPT